jgi:hypothetical protein
MRRGKVQTFGGGGTERGKRNTGARGRRWRKTA